jgi:UDP-N-acetylmuramyl pentapeptide synthase
MKYTISELSAVISAKITGHGNCALAVDQLLIDSRKLIHPETSLFFAIRGDRNDGHRFIKDMYDPEFCGFCASCPE